MRSRPDTHRAMPWSIFSFSSCGIFGRSGYQSFSLGMAPLSGFGAHPLASRWYRLGRFIWSHGRRFYNFQGLRTFKNKFDPVWEPRYLAASGAVRNLSRAGRHRDAGQRRRRATDRIAAPTRRQGATTRRAGERPLSGSRGFVFQLPSGPSRSTPAIWERCTSSILTGPCMAWWCCSRIPRAGLRPRTKSPRLWRGPAVWSLASTYLPIFAGSTRIIPAQSATMR